MAISKVVYGDNTLIDLTEDTISAEAVVEGVTFHYADGTTGVGTLSIADYVVEQGTSDNWTYRKWNSGLIEMMGYVTISLGSTWTSVGGHYRYVTSVTMPFSIPYTKRIECFGTGSVSGCIVLAHNGNTTLDANKVEVIAYKEQSGSATYSCKMNIKVSGYES